MGWSIFTPWDVFHYSSHSTCGSWICRFGVPVVLHSDQGANLGCEVIKAVCRLLEMEKMRTSAYNPQENGQVERFNWTVEAILAKTVKESEGLGSIPSRKLSLSSCQGNFAICSDGQRTVVVLDLGSDVALGLLHVVLFAYSTSAALSNRLCESLRLFGPISLLKDVF